MNMLGSTSNKESVENTRSPRNASGHHSNAPASMRSQHWTPLAIKTRVSSKIKTKTGVTLENTLCSTGENVQSDPSSPPRSPSRSPRAKTLDYKKFLTQEERNIARASFYRSGAMSSCVQISEVLRQEFSFSILPEMVCETILLSDVGAKKGGFDPHTGLGVMRMSQWYSFLGYLKATTHKNESVNTNQEIWDLWKAMSTEGDAASDDSIELDRIRNTLQLYHITLDEAELPKKITSAVNPLLKKDHLMLLFPEDDERSNNVKLRGVAYSVPTASKGKLMGSTLGSLKASTQNQSMCLQLSAEEILDRLENITTPESALFQYNRASPKKQQEPQQEAENMSHPIDSVISDQTAPQPVPAKSPIKKKKKQKPAAFVPTVPLCKELHTAIRKKPCHVEVASMPQKIRDWVQGARLITDTDDDRKYTKGTSFTDVHSNRNIDRRSPLDHFYEKRARRALMPEETPAPHCKVHMNVGAGYCLRGGEKRIKSPADEADITKSTNPHWSSMYADVIPRRASRPLPNRGSNSCRGTRLVPCRRCGHAFATSDEYCPGCGIKLLY